MGGQASGNGGLTPATRRLRIVLAPSAYYPHVGGIEELTRQLAHELESRGHEVSILTNRWPGKVSGHEVLDGLSVTRLSFPLPSTRPLAALRFLIAAPYAAGQVIRHLRAKRPDVVHVIGAGPQCVYLAILASALRTRLIFTAQGELTFDAHNVFRRSMTMRAGLRLMLRRGATVTACSSFVLHELTQVGSIRGEQVVIPNGVDPTDFSQFEAPRERGDYALALGRIVPQKGFDVLLEALACPDAPQLHLVIGGDGFERPALEAKARNGGLEDRVEFVGELDRRQVAEHLARARMFVLPSRSEPFGIALLEAMAAGLPAIATRAGGVTDFAQDEENALLVPPDDARELARALRRMHDDGELRSRLTRGGHATAEKLSWKQIVPRYELLYRGSRAAHGPEVSK